MVASGGRDPNYKTTNVLKNLNKLISQGWLPLASVTQILGYSSSVALYQRQREGKNPIPTVRVGKINRVTETTLIAEMESRAGKDDHIRNVLDIYQQIKYSHSPKRSKT